MKIKSVLALSVTLPLTLFTAYTRADLPSDIKLEKPLETIKAPMTARRFASDQEGWYGETELGWVSSEGNSSARALHLRAEVGRETMKWRNTFQIEVLNSKANSETAAERYFFADQLDNKITEWSYWFGYADYESDRFGSYDFQSHVAAGYGNQFIHAPTFRAAIEVGPGYNFSSIRESLSSSFASENSQPVLHSVLKATWVINPNAELRQRFVVDIGTYNTISKSETSLKTKINDALAMKVLYLVRYASDVAPGIKHKDAETAVTVVYSF